MVFKDVDLKAITDGLQSSKDVVRQLAINKAIADGDINQYEFRTGTNYSTPTIQTALEERRNDKTFDRAFTKSGINDFVKTAVATNPDGTKRNLLISPIAVNDFERVRNKLDDIVNGLNKLKASGKTLSPSKMKKVGSTVSSVSGKIRSWIGSAASASSASSDASSLPDSAFSGGEEEESVNITDVLQNLDDFLNEASASEAPESVKSEPIAEVEKKLDDIAEVLQEEAGVDPEMPPLEEDDPFIPKEEKGKEPENVIHTETSVGLFTTLSNLKRTINENNKISGSNPELDNKVSKNINDAIKILDNKAPDYDLSPKELLKVLENKQNEIGMEDNSQSLVARKPLGELKFVLEQEGKGKGNSKETDEVLDKIHDILVNENNQKSTFSLTDIDKFENRLKSLKNKSESYDAKIDENLNQLKEMKENRNERNKIIYEADLKAKESLILLENNINSKKNNSDENIQALESYKQKYPAKADKVNEIIEHIKKHGKPNAKQLKGMLGTALKHYNQDKPSTSEASTSTTSATSSSSTKPVKTAKGLIGQKLQYGGLLIDLKKLKKNILSVSYPDGKKVAGLPNVIIGDPFKKLITKKQVNSKRMKLTDAEKLHLNKLVEKSGIQLTPSKGKLLDEVPVEGSGVYFTNIADMKEKVKVLCGQIMAGNDSLAVKNELSEIVNLLQSKKQMSKEKAEEIIENFVM